MTSILEIPIIGQNIGGGKLLGGRSVEQKREEGRGVTLEECQQRVCEGDSLL